MIRLKLNLEIFLTSICNFQGEKPWQITIARASASSSTKCPDPIVHMELQITDYFLYTCTKCFSRLPARLVPGCIDSYEWSAAEPLKVGAWLARNENLKPEVPHISTKSLPFFILLLIRINAYDVCASFVTNHATDCIFPLGPYLETDPTPRRLSPTPNEQCVWRL